MNTTQPLVSVIIPCYNAMPFLPMALESIINQTYNNLEILCVNDGSTDETPEVLEMYAKQDSRIRVIHNENNLKLIGTLNKAISLAKGEYIARMDADDITDVTRIEKLLETLTKKQVDIVSCNSEYIDMSGKKVSSSYLKAINCLEIKLASYFFTPIGHALLLGRKDVFLNNPYSNEENALHSEDYELWTRMIRNNVRFCNLNKYLYSIRVNDMSVSRQFESIQISNFVKSAQIHQESLLNKQLNHRVVSVAVNRLNQSNRKEFKQGLKLIDEIYGKFKGETSFSKSETSSIRFIVVTQKVDVSIQGIIKGDFLLKVTAGLTLSKLIFANIFKSNFRKYVRMKF